MAAPENDLESGNPLSRHAGPRPLHRVSWGKWPAAAIALAVVAAVVVSPSPSAQPAAGQPRNEPRSLRPDIVPRPIPFSAERKREMIAYTKRHYGLGTWKLEDPQVIVEHFTATQTAQPVIAAFADNQPHLGESPGTCTHFVVDTDGTIYRLVGLGVMCRHTVGLNHTSIGIEMVGASDAQVMRNRREYDAAQALTLWLMQKYDIALDNVIGHNESLASPFHQEKVESWRCQTHADWVRADMNVFRRDLARLAREYAVPTGPQTRPAAGGC